MDAEGEAYTEFPYRIEYKKTLPMDCEAFMQLYTIKHGGVNNMPDEAMRAWKRIREIVDAEGPGE